MNLSYAEIRELVVAGAVLIVLILVLTRLKQPPGAGMQVQPIDELVRDVRHRVANVEQQVQQLPDHSMRLRTMEREVGEVRGALNSLISGQEQMSRQLQMLVEHHLQEPTK